jgi:hypothetical protein
VSASTPNRGYTYATSDDANDLALISQRLAEQIDADVQGITTIIDGIVSAPIADLPVNTGYVSYGSVAGDPDFALPRVVKEGRFGKMIGGWFARSTSLAVTAGATVVLGTLPADNRPTTLVPAVGILNLSGSQSACRIYLRPNGNVEMVALASGTFSTTSASFLMLPGVDWVRA